MIDFYSTLEVGRDAAQDEIKSAYKKAALKWHPDKKPQDPDNAELMFQAVVEAYTVLSDPQKRDLYDRSQAPPLPSDSHWTPACASKKAGTSSGQQGHNHTSNATFPASKQASASLDPFGEWGKSESWEDTKWGSSGSNFWQHGFGSGDYNIRTNRSTMSTMERGGHAGPSTATRLDGEGQGIRQPVRPETVQGYSGQTQGWQHVSSQRWASCNHVHQSFSQGWR